MVGVRGRYAQNKKKKDDDEDDDDDDEVDEKEEKRKIVSYIYYTLLQLRFVFYYASLRTDLPFSCL